MAASTKTLFEHIGKEHVMIDLETLGCVPGSIILSVGAVYFDPTSGFVDINNAFYKVISKKSCEDLGMVADRETELWWSQQSLAAREVIFQAHDDKLSTNVIEVLVALNKFIKPNTTVWCMGASFDFPIIECYYKKLDLKLPWKYTNLRCLRTLDAIMLPRIKVPKEDSPSEKIIKHHALSDAIDQAHRAIEELNFLNRINNYWIA